MKFIYLMIILLLLYSCTSEYDDINPKNYENYISISADQFPAVSPDGEWIAYTHICIEVPEPIDYPSGLYVMDKNGNNRRILVEGEGSQADWSPDGKLIAFSNFGTIQIVNFESNSLRTFQGVDNLPLFYPDWSPDGKSILFGSPFIKGGGGFICDVNFNYTKQIFNHYFFNAFPIKWCKNNQYICTSYSSKWEAEEIVIIDTSFVSPIRLTFNNNSDRDPAISPTGSYIAWSSSFEIYIMDIDGNNKKRLDYGSYPTWLPNEKSVIYSFVNDDYTKEVLFKIDINGKNKIQLTF